MSTCYICSKGSVTDGVLVDGSVFHTRCLEELKREVENLKYRERTLLAELQKPPSFMESIAKFFSGSRQAEFEAAKRSLVSQIHRAREAQEATTTRIRLVYDLWPTYPPDWDERRRIVQTRDHHSCSECGVGGKLHLHHIRALSHGGTNKIDNIALLCESCHSEAHGGRVFRYEGSERGEPTTIERKISLLNRAIAQKNNVFFHYKKPNGTVTKRTVTPRQMRKLTVGELQSLLGRKIKIEKEGKLCLFGYCHLRKADRTFAVHRMYKIETR